MVHSSPRPVRSSSSPSERTTRSARVSRGWRGGCASTHPGPRIRGPEFSLLIVPAPTAVDVYSPTHMPRRKIGAESVYTQRRCEMEEEPLKEKNKRIAEEIYKTLERLDKEWKEATIIRYRDSRLPGYYSEGEYE